MNPKYIRPILGWMAIVLLILTILAFQYSATPFLRGELFRGLIATAALYFVWPELEQLPKWLWLVIFFTFVIAAFRPQFLMIGLPLIFLIIFLLPKKKKR